MFVCFVFANILLARVQYESKISENGHILALEPLIKKIKAISLLQLSKL